TETAELGRCAGTSAFGVSDGVDSREAFYASHNNSTEWWSLRVACNSFQVPLHVFSLIVSRTDELKWGKHIGTDYLGNKYYENNKYFMGRNRWVVYGNRFGWDYEGSQVPPEWYVHLLLENNPSRHRWLHHMTDENPADKPPEKKKWMVRHSENTTLDPAKKYIPYSTTRPKVEPWKPT
ncbi:NADH dehydrogenase [ubiquinone] 1 alpha subcomplex subunit 12, partial [Fasciola hepatica]